MLCIHNLETDIKAKKLPFTTAGKYYSNKERVSHISLLVDPDSTDQVESTMMICDILLKDIATKQPVAFFPDARKIPLLFTGEEAIWSWVLKNLDHQYWYFKEPAFLATLEAGNILIVVYGDGGLIDISFSQDEFLDQRIIDLLEKNNIDIQHS